MTVTIGSRSFTLLRQSTLLHRGDVQFDHAVAQSVAVRRCAQYRKAFRWAAVSYPADILRMDAPAAWARRHRVSVAVGDAGDLNRALAAGIETRRIILRLNDTSDGMIRRSVDAGAGCVVVNSPTQVATLAGAVGRRQRVLVEMTDHRVDDVVEAVLKCGRLDLNGLYRQLAPGDRGAATVVAMIATMGRIAKQHRVIPVRLRLADVDTADWGCDPGDLGAISDAICDAVETGCIVAGCGRPAVDLSPSMSALRPDHRYR